MPTTDGSKAKTSYENYKVRHRSGAGPRFCLYVHHTDAEHEWAYDRKSSIGRLDKGLDEAKARGWTVVSMKDDWRRIFPPENK